MSLILVGFARENSTRVPQKMIRPFGDTTLFDLYINKFKTISSISNPFSRIVIGINKNDTVLYDKTKQSDLEIIERDDISIAKDIHGLKSTHNFLKDINEDYIMTVNACFPFLRINTILEIASFFIESKDIESLTCVRKRYNHFWDSITNKPINNKNPKCISTTTVPPILENVNHILIYKKDHIFKRNACWGYTKNDPYIYIIPESMECLDIDTMLDFKICEALYVSRN